MTIYLLGLDYPEVFLYKSYPIQFRTFDVKISDKNLLTCWKSRPIYWISRPTCLKSRPQCWKSRLCQIINPDIRQCGLDLLQGGLDFGQGVFDFQQVDFDLRRGSLNFQQVSKMLVLCGQNWVGLVLIYHYLGIIILPK